MPPRPLSLLSLLALVCASPDARAAEAWEVRAGLGAVFGTEFSDQRQQGLGGFAHLEVGVCDYLSLGVGGGYVRHFFGPGNAYSLAHAGAGVVVDLDVILFGVGLAWVPFASLRLGWLQVDVDGAAAESGLGVAVAIGLDHVFEEHYALGLAFEYHGLLTDLQGLPGYLALSLRVGLRWPEW